MALRDVIVIGGSTGGIDALQRVVAGLPPDLPAAVFVVVHVGEGRESYLPTILNRAGRLPAAPAVDEEPIRRGRIYVAPPGFQTYVHRGRLSVRRGPVENLHRPSIDALFRTAAHYYGSRVIGVVLSGAMDDGAAGLALVKESGGIAVVQDPSDAIVPTMPQNALARTPPDHCLPADQIGTLLTSLAGNGAGGHAEPPVEVPLETVEEAASLQEANRSDELGTPAEFVCPDCSGTLNEIKDSSGVHFRCRVGHAYSEEALAKAQNDSVERALWVALRALEERVALMRRIADNLRRRGHPTAATLFEEKSQLVDEDVKAVHALITTGRGLDPVEHETM